MYLQEKSKQDGKLELVLAGLTLHLTVRSPKGWEENFISGGVFFAIFFKLFHTVLNVYLYPTSLSSITVSQLPLYTEKLNIFKFLFS